VQGPQPAHHVGPGVQLTGRRTKANKQLLLQLLETFRSYRPGKKALTHVTHVEKPQGQLWLPLSVLSHCLPLMREIVHYNPPPTCPVVWQLIKSLIYQNTVVLSALGLSTKQLFWSHSEDVYYQYSTAGHVVAFQQLQVRSDGAHAPQQVGQ
jgi:hypothetical protein